MKRKGSVWIRVCLLSLVMLSFAQADWGGGGSMILPGGLVLVPQNAMLDRYYMKASRYSWSYAQLSSEPTEREEASLAGPEPTNPEAYAAAERFQLPERAYFTLEWTDGWDPDTVTVFSWRADVLSHPEQAEGDFLGVAEVRHGGVALEADRVYQFRASWGSDPLDKEFGEADYYLWTGRMTEAEFAAAKIRMGAPYSEEDLRCLTMTIEGVDCVLGETTPRQLEVQGLIVGKEHDGTFYVVDENGFDYVYLSTVNGGFDDPVLAINAFWAYEMSIRYRDTEYNPEQADEDSDDPDEDEWTEEEAEMPWNPRDYVAESAEGIYTRVISLSNGREVEVSTHGGPPALRLLPEKAFRPLEFSEFDVNLRDGEYHLRILDGEEPGASFTAELYQEDLYPAEGLETLSAGDRMQLNGKVISITELKKETREPDAEEDPADETADGEAEAGANAEEQAPEIGYIVGYEIPEEEYTDSFCFRSARGQKDLYHAINQEGWAAITRIGSVQVSLPLPESFVYSVVSAGEAVQRPTTAFLEALESGEAKAWSPYHTSIAFENGLPARILHSGDPQGPVFPARQMDEE